MHKNIDELKEMIKGFEESDALRILSEEFKGNTAFSTSLSLEDQAITHLIFSNELPIKVFTLDTGRLFYETYSVLSRTAEYYDKKIEVFYPATTSLEKLVNEKGLFSFYESAENRKECCYIRKVEPLNRALSGIDLWITGIRAEHSTNREKIEQLEWDSIRSLFKFHPLLGWTNSEVKTFIKKNNIPYNRLHDEGFVSIGCQPCTRSIKPGEDFRAGRWWWEDQSKKECGLHAK